MSALVLIDPTELYNLINQETIYSSLSDPVFLLLIDARANEDYNESHIITAKRATKNGNNEYIAPFDSDLECKSHVVVYDGNTDSLDEPTPAIECGLKMFEFGSRNAVEILKGGYEAFSALYPFHRTQKIIYMPRELDVIQTYPSEIVPGLLYLGNWKHGTIPYIQKELRVKAHINCCQEHGSFLGDEGPSLMHIAVSDTVEPAVDIYRYFEAACKFIDEHREENHVVLVFSQKGISRSATIAIAYLIWANGWRAVEAYEHVKKCRPQICPNVGFMRQLSTWQHYLDKDKVEGITESVTRLDLESTPLGQALAAEGEAAA